jgi:FHA domain-containing protein
VTATTCPDGHRSDTDDYCDVCGTPMAAAPAPSSPATPSTAAAPAGPAPQVCSSCGAARDGRFCEDCGHDSALPVPAAAPGARDARDTRDAGADADARATRSGWSAVVRADRGWFEVVRGREGPDAAGLAFPLYCPERRFTLDGSRLSIGRRSRSRGIEPDIDLSGPPLDPGVSALHAVLLSQPDGGWQIVDLDSTNGTAVGDTVHSALIPSNTPVPIGAGDQIRLGAWTTITLVHTP